MEEKYISYQEQYADILTKLLNKPDKFVVTRNGLAASNFCEKIIVDLDKEFPLMEIKHVSFKNIVHELLWFINGNTNIKYLVDNNCNIWNDDAFRYFNELFPSIHIDKKTFISNVKDEITINQSELGTTYHYGDLNLIYGYNWRSFGGSVDQLQNVINTLITDPNNRRMYVVATNPADDSSLVGLPSCHNYFQFYATPLTISERTKYAYGVYGVDMDNESLDIMNVPKYKLSIYFNMRSVDFALGNPYNIPSYSLLLMMVSNVVNMIPSKVAANFVDCHLYEPHFEGAKIWLSRYNNPEQTKILSSIVNLTNKKCIDDYVFDDFKLTHYHPNTAIKMPLLT